MSLFSHRCTWLDITSLPIKSMKTYARPPITWRSQLYQRKNIRWGDSFVFLFFLNLCCAECVIAETECQQCFSPKLDLVSDWFWRQSATSPAELWSGWTGSELAQATPRLIVAFSSSDCLRGRQQRPDVAILACSNDKNGSLLMDTCAVLPSTGTNKSRCSEFDTSSQGSGTVKYFKNDFRESHTIFTIFN